ncbi:polymyxin B resistance protein pmrD [Enterobacteriaceae bacterium RIT693]|jgi:hypothetical protein|nr:polymyxin B resistance protein pmrD [Enterobacteriaceae bacterium RIT693]
MEWLVIDVIRLRSPGRFMLVLWAGALKMTAEVASSVDVQAGDMLRPVQDGEYLVNHQAGQSLKAISAVRFSATHWAGLKKISRHVSCMVKNTP